MQMNFQIFGKNESRDLENSGRKLEIIAYNSTYFVFHCIM